MFLSLREASINPASMLRRSHKKSRAGCSECKRRHIKCDENHPVCVNCSTAGIQCSFALPAQSIIVPPGDEPKTFITADKTSRSSTPTSISSIHPALVQVEANVNARHIELFYYIVNDGEWFGDDDQKGTRPHVMKHAFTSPFLLNEILAVSALYLSTRRPAQQSLYRDEATRLQSQALRVFHETIHDLNNQNIIPVFLFSGILSIATFFETFHDPMYEASDWTFFENIVQSIRLIQGVRSIIRGWWHFLITSDIKDILLK